MHAVIQAAGTLSHRGDASIASRIVIVGDERTGMLKETLKRREYHITSSIPWERRHRKAQEYQVITR